MRLRFWALALPARRLGGRRGVVRLAGRPRARGVVLGHEVERRPPARRVDRGDDAGELVAQADAPARAAPDERHAVLVAVEALARIEAPGRQEALEDVAEAHEQPGADEARHDAVERLLPAVAAQPVAQQEGQADRLGAALGVGRLALALRAAQGDLRQIARLRRVLAEARERAGRAVHDDVGIAPDRRREMHVRRRGQRGVAAVDRVVARELERAQEQRCRRPRASPGARA